MATATNLGPIEINQVNSTFYVGGDGGFDSIQAAVDYVQKYNAGVGHVTILHGYSGSEAIGSVLRGSNATYIEDERDSKSQVWQWNTATARFSPADFSQLAHGTFGGQVTAHGLAALDFSASNASIGVGNDGPGWALTNVTAPTDQKVWDFFAYTDRLIFSSEEDTGIDHYWLWANRSGPIVTKVVIVPNVDVQGVLTSQGSPVRTFANTPDSGGGGGGTGGVNPGIHGQLPFYGVDGPLVSPSQITTDTGTQSTLNVPSVITAGGPVKAYGFQAPDFVASHAYIGTGSNTTIPELALVNAAAPVNQRLWAFFALTDRFAFSAEADAGTDTFWLQALRSGAAVTKVIIGPPLNVTGQITSGSAVKGYGFQAPDLTASNAYIGTGTTTTIPELTLINAAAPADQRLWAFFALTDRYVCSAELDSGVDTYWLQALRTAGAVTKVIIAPALDVTGVITSQGSPVRTFANTTSGGGGVNPGTSGMLSFYPAAGSQVSPSGISTDTATMSTLYVPAMITSSQAKTDSSIFADTIGHYVQEPTVCVVGGGAISMGSPWTVNQLSNDVMYGFQRGITQLRTGRIDRFSTGDTAALYYYTYSDGGVTTWADEGVAGITVACNEYETYYHGTVNTTTGYGDRAPTFTSTSGSGHTSDGAFMLNISKGQIAGSWSGNSVNTAMDTGGGAVATYLNQLPVTNVVVTTAAWDGTKTYAAGNIVSFGGNNYVSLAPGNHNNTPPSAAWVLLPSGQIPISTAIGSVAQDHAIHNPDGSTTYWAVPPTYTPTNQPVSQTLTVNLCKINGIFPGFAIGDVVTVAGDAMPEQAIIIAPISRTGNQQTLTLKLRNPNPRAFLFKGGIQGQYISMDFSYTRSSYYALGSQTGTEVIYAFNAQGQVEGRTLPQLGAEPASSSGANAGFHLFPGAEIDANTSQTTCTLEQNGVRWEAGDVVENPHYPAFGGSGIMLTKYQMTPTPTGYGSYGLRMELEGPGFSGSAAAVFIRNTSPSTMFYDDGGHLAAPGGIQLIGYFTYGLWMSAPQSGGACILVDRPAAPTHNPNAVVNVVEINYAGGGLLSFNPATSYWNFGGSVSTPLAMSVGTSLGVGGAGSFMTGGGTQSTVTIDGANDYRELVFTQNDTSSSGTKSRIMVMAHPFGDIMYFDTLFDAKFIWRSASYGNPNYTVMQLDYTNGLSVAIPGGIHATAGNITASGTTSGTKVTSDNGSGNIMLLDSTSPSVAYVDWKASGGGEYGMALWGTGAGGGLLGVLGLYRGGSSQMIWATNGSGDMFFNLPFTNVVAGVGATAHILATGAIDGTAFSVAGVAGGSGTFTSADSKTVTVSHGLITSIV